jgi:hypothetical protein
MADQREHRYERLSTAVAVTVMHTSGTLAPGTTRQSAAAAIGWSWLRTLESWEATALVHAARPQRVLLTRVCLGTHRFIEMGHREAVAGVALDATPYARTAAPSEARRGVA